MPEKNEVELSDFRFFPEITGLEGSKMFHSSSDNLVIEDTMELPLRGSLRMIDGTSGKIDVVLRVGVPVCSKLLKVGHRDINMFMMILIIEM
mgnify:CR=1 FL=1